MYSAGGLHMINSRTVFQRKYCESIKESNQHVNETYHSGMVMKTWNSHFQNKNKATLKGLRVNEGIRLGSTTNNFRIFVTRKLFHRFKTKLFKNEIFSVIVCFESKDGCDKP